MPHVFSTALCLTLTGMLAGTPLPAAAQGAHQHLTPQPAGVTLVAAKTGVDSAKLTATKAALRDLWIGHVFWVRNVVTAGLAGNGPEQAAAEQQVVANAHAIAAAIEPFYGAAGRDGLFKLLAGHYGAIRAYLDATIAKNATAQSKAITDLMNNAEQIAGFLSHANPNIPKDAAFGLFQAHAGHHISQIQELMAKDYAGEAQTWAAMTQHMYMISDVLADALARQFPQKF
jgi:hypothetical protein